LATLEKYPSLKMLSKNSSDIDFACCIASEQYQGMRRTSGKLVIDHCFETAENTSNYTDNPIYITTAIYHDLVEDLGFSFKDLRAISGAGGTRVATMVCTLSKRPDLKGYERTAEYLDRISKATRDQDLGVGIVKLSDRLSNLTDLEYLPRPKRQFIAKQTLEFYVPLALRIGLIGLAHRLTVMSRPYL